MKNSKGFSFVELLVVITIIAVLTGIGAVTYTSTMRNARNAKRVSDIQVIRSALEICRSQDGAYPATIVGSVSCASGPVLNPTPLDPAGGTYSYNRTTTTSYTLSCTGEGGVTCESQQP